MSGIDTPWGAAFQAGASLIDELFTSDEEREEAKLKLVALEQSGKLKELDTRMSAIISESQSTDPWTSRARHSFLYVIYILILFSIPLIISFIPELQPYVMKGWEMIGKAPEWYLWLYGAMVISVWGLRGIAKSVLESKLIKR